MAEEKFIMVSLKADDAKRLAQVISNDTSRRILDYLAGRKDATETKIAQELSIPLSTAHYNLQALEKAKLVSVNEFHYSSKGKEVNHYSLANKYVIISPKEPTESLKDKLKRVLPVALFGLAFAGALQIWSAIKSSAYPHALRKGIASELDYSADSAASEGGGLLSSALPEAAQEAAALGREAVPLAASKAGEAAADSAILSAADSAGNYAANETLNQTGAGVGSLNLADSAGESIRAITEPCIQAAQPIFSSIAVWFLIGLAFAIIMIFIVEFINRKKR